MPLEATWMVLEIVRLHEVSQTEKEISYDIPYMWNLKKKKNELTYKTERDSQTQEPNLLQEGRVGGRDGQGVWDAMPTLLHLIQTASKDLRTAQGTLLCHTADWMGGELGREWIHV